MRFDKISRVSYCISGCVKNYAWDNGLCNEFYCNIGSEVEEIEYNEDDSVDATAVEIVRDYENKRKGERGQQAGKRCPDGRTNLQLVWLAAVLQQCNRETGTKTHDEI